MSKTTKISTQVPHDLWLASLGAVSLTRKQAVKAYDVLIKEGTQFRAVTNKRIDGLSNQARNQFDAVKAKVEPVRVRANEMYGNVRHQVETRLAAVTSMFGDKPVAKKAKTVRKSTSAKKTVRKSAAKPTARRSTKKAA